MLNDTVLSVILIAVLVLLLTGSILLLTRGLMHLAREDKAERNKQPEAKDDARAA
jgi:hypothetical protein